MYDTEKRVALVKKRIAEHRRRQVRRSIRSLSALCVLLIITCTLVQEGAGGYVLVAVAVFTLAVVITVICMRLHERERQKQK